MIHADRLASVAESDEPPLALLRGRPGLSPFLRDADQDHPTPLGKAIAIALHDGVLTLALAEFEPWDAPAALQARQRSVGRLLHGTADAQCTARRFEAKLR